MKAVYKKLEIRLPPIENPKKYEPFVFGFSEFCSGLDYVLSNLVLTFQILWERETNKLSLNSFID